MASEPIHLPHPERFSEWLPEFLKRELAPYPGRGALVARIVISATLTMILLATFRIPGGVVGALSAFIFSRENLVATARSALAIIAAFAVGAFFIPVGARLLASFPVTLIRQFPPGSLIPVEMVSVDILLPLTDTGLALNEHAGAFLPEIAKQERVTLPV